MVSLQEQKDYLLLLRRQKVLTSAQYKAAVSKAEALEEKRLDKKRQEQELKVALEQMKKRAEEAKAKAQEKKESKKVKKISSGDLILKIRAGSNGEAVVRAAWKVLPGTSRLIIGTPPTRKGFGKLNQFTDTIITRSGTKDKDYKLFRTQFMIAGESEADFIFEMGDVLRFFKPSKIEAMLLVQRFRDSKVNHCVFQPIIQALENKMTEVSESTAKRTGQRIKALKKLEAEYLSKSQNDQGVHEEDMEALCKLSGLRVTLEDIFQDVVKVWNDGGKVGAIRLRNTRENHVESGLVTASGATEVGEETMTQIWDELKNSDDWFRVEGNFQDGLPTKIETLKGAFTLANEDKEICNEFDKELGIMNYKVNARKFPELNSFLKAGRIVNGWNCDINGGEATGSADMPKAYAQFKKCHKYSGFLGMIHQFRSGSFDREFVESHLGYYGVRVLGGGDWLVEKLGLVAGIETVLFSPELLYFMDCGVSFEITQGAWGSQFDFDFPQQMLKKGRYAYWAGKLGMEREEVSHTVPATREWANHLSVKHDVYFWEGQKLVTIKKPAAQVFTAHHILGAITAYTRIQMMEAMREFQPDQLVRVVMDGIYYTGEKPASLSWFSNKELKKGDYSAPWYNDEVLPSFPAMGQIDGNSLLTGQGGAGKTYSVFSNPGFHNVLYVSPSHLLGQDVRKKFEAKYTTINKLIGIECQSYKEQFRVPSVVFVDEITQVPSEWVDKVFEMYPESLVLLAGDIDSTGRWYQCRSGDGDSWNDIWNPAKHPGVDVIDYVVDRRSKDDDIKALKLKIREAMRNCSEDAPLMEMMEWASNNLPLSDKVDFKKGDTVIAGTHRTNKKLLDAGVVSGWYKKGGYVSFVEPSDMKGWEQRGSFTIHAYQGKTIESGTVWIVVGDMFEYAMLYTAVSRAVNFSQLKFVWKV